MGISLGGRTDKLPTRAGRAWGAFHFARAAIRPEITGQNREEHSISHLPGAARRHSNGLPAGREKVTRVVLLAGEPARRGYHDLVRIRTEPGAPPTEGAVSDDVVPAQAHEVKVLVVVPGVIAGHDGHGMVEVQVFRGPFRLVGENKEMRLRT